MSSLKVFALLIVISGVALSSGGTASYATTAPSQHYQALVTITNKGMKLFEFVGYNDAPEGDLVPTSGPIPRGDNISFTIINHGTKPQDFTILGYKTPRIRPGHKAQLHVVFAYRGTFRYGSTLDKAPSFHGVIHVY